MNQLDVSNKVEHDKTTTRKINLIKSQVVEIGVKSFSRWHFFFFIIFLGLACQKSEPKTEEAVARVGAEALTLSDIRSELPSQFRHRLSKNDLQDYIVRWIDSQILYQEAKKRQLDQSDEVRRELRRLERELVVNALLDRELNKTFTVSDQEIEKYYADNHQAFTRAMDEVHVQYMRVRDKSLADSLVAALRQGGDFLQIARRHAGDDSLGIDLYLTEEETPPVIVSSVFTIYPGAVSRPIQIDQDFHIFKMIKKLEAGSQRSLSRARDEIVAKIQNEKRQERYKQLLAELKNNTAVEKNLLLLENISIDSAFAQAEQK